jgi:hypothetical protein
MVALNDDPDVDDFFFAETIDDDPDVGDDVAAVTSTFPGGDGDPLFDTLNFMSVVAWVTTAEPAEDATEVTVDFGVGHMGLATPEADIGDIPAERLAHYDGRFLGVVVDPGTGEDGFVGVATGDAEFTADFGDGTVEGGVFDIFVEGIELETGDIFRSEGPVGSIAFEDVTIDGNTFAGSVVPHPEGGFADFDAASTGNLDGVFYGPVIDIDEDHMGPAEAGAVLTLHDATEGSGAFITGVIGAGIDIDD